LKAGVISQLTVVGTRKEKDTKAMAKKTKAATKRTKVNDLPKSKREMSGKDMQKVKAALP